DYRKYDGLGHVPLVEADSPLIPELVEWTRARLSGEPAAGAGVAASGLLDPGRPRRHWNRRRLADGAAPPRRPPGRVRIARHRPGAPADHPVLRRSGPRPRVGSGHDHCARHDCPRGRRPHHRPHRHRSGRCHSCHPPGDPPRAPRHGRLGSSGRGTSRVLRDDHRGDQEVVTRTVGTAAATIFNLFTVGVLVPYFAYAIPRMKNWVLRLVRRKERADLLRLVNESTERISGYIL